jgi:hypothetical protein
MDLRQIQKPLKERYRQHPDASKITLHADGSGGEDAMSCSVDLGRVIQAAEAHTGVGGAGTAACSGDLLLGALAACAQLTCQMVATATGIDAAIARCFRRCANPRMSRSMCRTTCRADPRPLV